MEIKITLPDDQIVTREYVDQKFEDLKSWIKEYAGGEPEPELPPKCDEGPEIREVKWIDSRKMGVLFHAEKVFEARVAVFDQSGKEITGSVFSVKTGQKIDKNKVFEPDGNQFIISTLEDQRAGEVYRVLMVATKCTGKGEFFF